MIITAQNWDGVTAPALPTGWGYSSGFATTSGGAGVSALSAPNCLTNPTNGDSTASFQTADGSGGQVSASAAFTSDAVEGQSGGPAYDTAGSVLARWNGTTSNRTCYRATLDFFAETVSLFRDVNGTATTLATVGGSFIGPYASAPGTWFTVRLLCDGTALSVSVQRQGDGYWLQGNGGWAAAQTNCLQTTDASISGSGYAGLIVNPGISGETPGDVYTDNFLFESLIDPKPQAVVVPAGYVWHLRD